MATRFGAHLMTLTDQLRFEPVTKRIRAYCDGEPVLDSTDAALVWEPRRVVPMYAVPAADLLGTLTPCPSTRPPDDLPPVLGPVSFGWHFTEGESFTVHVSGRSFEDAAFRPDDPDLGGRVVLEWSPFEWVEESQPVTGHPHDPFKRLDLLPSDRHIQVRHDGQLLADSKTPVALYETHLPVRWYLPPADVRSDLLAPSAFTSTCAYKGHASYFSWAPDDDGADLAWTYPDPLPEAAAIRDHICFYAEWTDLTVDGVDVPRPQTFWSRRDGLA